MSGVGGLMIGIALLHLLPHGGEVLQSHSKAGVGVLIGLTIMFLLIRLFHTHDHSVQVVVERDADVDATPGDTHQPTAIMVNHTFLPMPKGSVGRDSSSDSFCTRWSMGSHSPAA